MYIRTRCEVERIRRRMRRSKQRAHPISNVIRVSLHCCRVDRATPDEASGALIRTARQISPSTPPSLPVTPYSDLSIHSLMQRYLLSPPHPIHSLMQRYLLSPPHPIYLCFGLSVVFHRVSCLLSFVFFTKGVLCRRVREVASSD